MSGMDLNAMSAASTRFGELDPDMGDYVRLQFAISAYLSAVGQKAGTLEVIDAYVNSEPGKSWADAYAPIPAPSVAEAAEPVAWQHRSQFFNKDSQVLCAWSDWDDGKASDQLKARCSAGFGNFEERPLFTHPAPSPVVPSGLEALEPAAFANAAFFTERRAEFEQNGTVVEARPRGMCMHPLYSADAIAALIAERDEAKRWRQEVEALSAQWMEETGQAYAYVGIRDYAAVKERAETAERALSAALTRIAEIEGETIERIAKANERLPNIETPLMGGDNLAICLCSFFDDGDKETEDDTGWSQRARDGYEEVIKAIRDHYSATIRSSATKQEKADAATLRALADRKEGDA